jgi:curved DNA-binding protein
MAERVWSEDAGIDFDEIFGSMFGARGRQRWGPIQGADQEVELEVSVPDAYTGVRRWLTIGGPEGTRSVEVTIPPGVTEAQRPGTSSGRRLRLRGRGIPGPRGRNGDLYAEVRIVVPSNLTEEERRLFSELAATSTFDPRSRP